MNDFLVKPIDPLELTAILARWIKPYPMRVVPQAPLRQPVPAARPVAPSVSTEGLPQGVAGLDPALGLTRMMNKRPLYLAMLRRYVAGQQSVVQELRDVLAAADLPTAERLAHNAKAVAGNIGATLVQDCAGALESALRQRDSTQRIGELVDEFAAPLAVLLDGLAQAFVQEEATA